MVFRKDKDGWYLEPVVKVAYKTYKERKQFEEYFSKVWVRIDLIQTIGVDRAFKLENDRYFEEVVQEHWAT